MDQPNNSVPFDPDFDSGVHQEQGITNSSAPVISAPVEQMPVERRVTEQRLDEIHPVMAFYAGIACSVLVFGLVGIIFLISIIY